MALKPEVLDALLAAGASAEMIVAAIKADMADDELRKEVKREQDAARQRKSRANRRSHGPSRDVTVTPCDPPIDNIHTPRSSNDEQTPKPKSDKPEGVEAEVWTDFKALRQKLRAPITKTAMVGIRREAEKAGMSLNAALAECVERSWRGFKAEWMANSRQPSRPSSQAPPSMLAALQAERICRA